MNAHLVRMVVVLGACSVCLAQNALPDLIVDASGLQNSVSLKTVRIRSKSCAYQEGCVTGTGKPP